MFHSFFLMFHHTFLPPLYKILVQKTFDFPDWSKITDARYGKYKVIKPYYWSAMKTNFKNPAYMFHTL